MQVVGDVHVEDLASSVSADVEICGDVVQCCDDRVPSQNLLCVLALVEAGTVRVPGTLPY